MDEAFEELAAQLEAAREAMHADPTDENRAAFKDLSKQVAEARTAWRGAEEEAGRRAGPRNETGSVEAALEEGDAVAEPPAVEASSEVN